MNAKEYLRQIRFLDIKINQRINELNQIRESAVSLTSPQMGDKVQSSNINSSMSAVDKYVDMENDINKMIDRMTNIRHEIIEKIQKIDDDRFEQILYKRYVEFKSFELISCEMGYDYKYVCKLHGNALQKFSEEFMK